MACTSPGLPAWMVGQQAVKQVLPLNTPACGKAQTETAAPSLGFTTAAGFTPLSMC